MTKSRSPYQLELDLGLPGRGEAPRRVAQGVEAVMASAEPESPASTEHLMEAICAPDNIEAALDAVVRNKGAPGIDGITVKQLPAVLKARWREIEDQLLQGRYQPQPVRRVKIPKPAGETRNLGIPTVIDRVIQQAVLQRLQPQWDPTFSEHSYGFRPGRSAHQAVAQAQACVVEGYRFVVDIDLAKFFLITHYPQPSRSGIKQEHTAVSAGLNDGAQQGAISKGAQRGPVCCSLRNRGSVPGGGDALALAIRLCLPGLRRGASQLRQDPGALPVYRLSTADIRDRRNDFRGDQGAPVHLVSRHVPPHSEQGRHLQH